MSDMKKMPVGSLAPKKNFKVTDEDESCVGDLFDPCGVCVTKGELRDGTLVNRLLMCCFAVVMLWASSFQTAVFIANSSVSSPLFGSVRDSCDAVYAQSKSQKQDYVECVDRQLGGCDASFETVLNEQVKRTNELLVSNAEVLRKVAKFQEACSESFTTAQAAISKWVTTGLDYRLYYTCPTTDADATAGFPTTPYCNATCGYEGEAASLAAHSCSCAEVADMVGDVGALRAAAFATATDYSEYSQGVVTHMVGYSLARSRYDAMYGYNKTEPLRQALGKALSNLNAPSIQGMNASFEALGLEADLMMACVSMRGQDAPNTPCTVSYLDSLREQYEAVRAETERQLAVAKEGVAEMAQETQEFVTQVLDALSQFMTFYNGVFNSLNGFNVVTDDNLPWLSMNPNLFQAPEPPWPTVPTYPAVPGADYIYEEVADQFQDFADELGKAGRAVGKAAEAMGDALAGLADNFDSFSPDDYHPPQYADFSPASSGANNEEQAESEHKSESTAFEYSTASNLNAFAELNAHIGDDTELSSYNLSYSSGDDDLTFSGLQFKFVGLTPSTVDWDLLYWGVGAMFNLIIALDFFYRFFKTLYYIRQFWSRAGLEIPAADIRQDKYEFSISGGSDSGGSSSGGSGGGDGGCGGCITCLLCPCWGALFCLVLLGFIVVNLVILYIPVVNEYTQVCVNHKPPPQGRNGGNQTGTFLTANIYSLAFNYAAEAGNEDLVEGLEAYHTRSADYCGAYTTFTQEQQAEDELLLRDLAESHRRTRNDVLMMDQCVNLTIMDGLFERACCDSTGSCDSFAKPGSLEAPLWYSAGSGNSNITADGFQCPRNQVTGDPYPKLSSLLHAQEQGEDAGSKDDNAANTAQCLEDPALWLIGDASFYCGELPPCEVTCNGPNRPLLQQASEQCGCMAEWMMHTWWVQVLGALVVYGVLNGSRVVVLSGVVRLCWRWMSPNVFTYRATTTLDGYYLAPPMSSQHGSFKKMLHAELGKEIKSYERMGWMFVLAGLGLNYVWIYYFAFFSDDRLYYDPNAEPSSER